MQKNNQSKKYTKKPKNQGFSNIRLSGYLSTNPKREHIERLRILSKEKYKDVLTELLEDLGEIKNFGEQKEKISAKIAEIEAKLLDKMERMKTADCDEKFDEPIKQVAVENEANNESCVTDSGL